ncbi:uncharacterized protein N7483_013085 [Penicillium malachiteum]|uniref:uncharacterized protein n=1 Tax=Penicillium malachiteum TaxID=1324776 RepID=UPI002547DFCB|nr:uncharacterized protein N7483_013085 [Penicillium malachiteum]KAJ5715904.1 hypothetical protein N7483_013085 [Penicillium malachiteum]
MTSNMLPGPIDEVKLKARLEFLDNLEAKLATAVQWKECESPAEYHKMRREGTNGFMAPVLNPAARLANVTGRDGNQIELRIIAPTEKASRGVLLHFHAGGFVIGNNASYDTYLTTLSRRLGLTMVSVEYRLAPDHLFPAPLHDCVDAALYALSPAGEKELGAPLKIICGESAGGWLAISTALSLRRDHGIEVKSKLDAVISGYGIFDLTHTPSLLEHSRNIVLSTKGMMEFCEASFNQIPMSERKNPLVSLLYADVKEMPPALFLTGQLEPLIDDSVFMAARWQLAGNDTQLNLVQEACHAFTIIPMGDATEEGLDIIVNFVQQKSS